MTWVKLDDRFSDNPKIAAGATVLDNAKVRFWGDTEQAFFTQLPEAIAGLRSDGAV